MARRQHFILCFDFDGTLIHSESKPAFHPMLGEMLSELKSQGAAFVINTGRSLPQTLQGLTQHGILVMPDYIIAQECNIHCATADGRWEEAREWNQEARKAHDRFVRDHQQALDDIRSMVDSQTKARMLEGGHGDMGIIANSSAEMALICDHIDQQRRKHPQLGYHRNSIYLRFSHSHYNKGSALSELQRLMGLNASRCLAAGDNYNDLSMLHPSRATMLAAPFNALPEIKQQVLSHGGFVASGSASDGMIQALRHFFHQSPPKA